MRLRILISWLVVFAGISFFILGCGESPVPAINKKKNGGDRSVLLKAWELADLALKKKPANHKPKKNEDVWQGELKHYFEKYIHKPYPFPIKRTETLPKEVIPKWWEKPNPLTQDEIALLRYFSSVTWQLPFEKRKLVWSTGGGGTINPIRFNGAFTGYAAVSLAMRTPAYVGLTDKIIENIIDQLIDRRAWVYIREFGKNRNPAAKHNIMLTGHLLQLMAFLEAMTGKDHYRKEGFDFVWDKRTKFHYTVGSLIDVTVKQMQTSPYGGVHCEPNLIFFACNDHPHIALLLYEKLGLGDWSKERDRWENWALNSFYDNLGGGAFKVAFEVNLRAFTPTGYPGMDAWSLGWYQPWATDHEIPDRIWPIVRKYIRWDELEGYKRPIKKKFRGPADFVSLVNNEVQALLPHQPASTGLYSAAVVCNDPVTAARLRELIERKYAVRKNGMFYLEMQHKYEIGATASMAMGVSTENGSNLRHMVFRPLPRSYFSGPLLDEVHPEETAVYQAYQDGSDLVIEVDEKGPVDLLLKNVASIRKIEGLPRGSWHYKENSLHIKGKGRRRFRIVVG